jgi:hypothetical protein
MITYTRIEIIHVERLKMSTFSASSLLEPKDVTAKLLLNKIGQKPGPR